MSSTDEPKNNSEFIIFKTEDEEVAVDVRVGLPKIRFADGCWDHRLEQPANYLSIP